MDDLEKKKDEEFKYVRETVVDKALLKKRKKRKIALLLFAIVVVLALIFIGVKFFASKESGSTEESEQQATGNFSEPIEIVLSNEFDYSQMNKEYYKKIYNTLKEVGESTNRYMVTITCAENDDDFLNAVSENVRITSGIITNTDDDVTILTDYSTVSTAKVIMVKFFNGDSVQATLLRTDENSGIAILRIPITAIVDETRELIEAPTFGYSEYNEPGEPVIIVGNPYGDSHYMTFGVLTSTTSVEYTTDDVYRLLATNSVVSGNKNGFIFNLDGKVIGMVSSQFGVETMSNVLSGIEISDLETIITKMSNDKGIPYLGVKGREITNDIIDLAQEDLPYGIYVEETEIGSPAYKTGIVSGDIIVKIDYNDVRTFADFKRIIENKNVNESTNITLKRKSRDGYIEYNYNVLLEVR